MELRPAQSSQLLESNASDDNEALREEEEERSSRKRTGGPFSSLLRVLSLDQLTSWELVIFVLVGLCLAGLNLYIIITSVQRIQAARATPATAVSTRTIDTLPPFNVIVWNQAPSLDNVSVEIDVTAYNDQQYQQVVQDTVITSQHSTRIRQNTTAGARTVVQFTAAQSLLSSPLPLVLDAACWSVSYVEFAITDATTPAPDDSAAYGATGNSIIYCRDGADIGSYFTIELAVSVYEKLDGSLIYRFTPYAQRGGPLSTPSATLYIETNVVRQVPWTKEQLTYTWQDALGTIVAVLNGSLTVLWMVFPMQRVPGVTRAIFFKQKTT
jgi:hypothetical protein